MAERISTVIFLLMAFSLYFPLVTCPFSLDHFIRPREKFRRECQSNLFRCLQVDHKLKLRCLLHRQISRFGTFKYLVHVNSGSPIEISVVRAVGHEAAFVNKLLLEVNCRQPMFVSKLNDLPSLGEKAASGNRHNRVDLLLLSGLKGALQTLGIEFSLDVFQFQFQRRSSGSEFFQLEVCCYAASRRPQKSNSDELGDRVLEYL